MTISKSTYYYFITSLHHHINTSTHFLNITSLHHSLFLLSIQMVTGPLFTNATFISAANVPV